MAKVLLTSFNLLPNWAKLIFWLEVAAISGYYAFNGLVQ